MASYEDLIVKRGDVVRFLNDYAGFPCYLTKSSAGEIELKRGDVLLVVDVRPKNGCKGRYTLLRFRNGELVDNFFALRKKMWEKVRG